MTADRAVGQETLKEHNPGRSVNTHRRHLTVVLRRTSFHDYNMAVGWTPPLFVQATNIAAFFSSCFVCLKSKAARWLADTCKLC